MFDTHCHLTYDGLYNRIDDVLRGAAEAGVHRMISVGTSPDDAKKAAALAEKYEQVYATVGLHPHYCEKWPDEAVVADSIRTLAAHPRVVAIGEMGLDRHYPEPPIELQKRYFEMQLGVVKKLDRNAKPQAAKPIIIHNREATDETLAIIRASGIAGDRFVFHCFTGTGEELDKILDLGAMVSFTGIATFGSATEIAACAARMPVDRIMIETDSPYLTPEPYRKVRPNEPKYVAMVATFLAAKRKVAEEAFIAQVDANARRVFGIE
ncbi:MAG: TatD family hydrolase [Phycisphaeraceae bacterium]